MSAGTHKVDIAAAGRFINHAIPRAQRLAAVETADDNASTAADSSRASTPAAEISDVGMASRFKMARDAQSEEIASEAEDAVSIVEEVSEKQEVSSPFSLHLPILTVLTSSSLHRSVKANVWQPKISWTRKRQRRQRVQLLDRPERKRLGRARASVHHNRIRLMKHERSLAIYVVLQVVACMYLEMHLCQNRTKLTLRGMSPLGSVDGRLSSLAKDVENPFEAQFMSYMCYRVPP